MPILTKISFLWDLYQRNKNDGKSSYYHIYSCIDIKQIKEKMKACIDEWYKHIEKVLTNFKREIG